MSMSEAEVQEFQKQQQIDLVHEQLEIIEPYLMDDDLTDIMINQDGKLFVDSNSQGMIETKVMIDEYTRNSIAQLLAGYNKKIITKKEPILSGRLPSGERVEIVTGETTGYETTVSIRKLNKRIITLDEYEKTGSMTKIQKEYIRKAISNHKNIVAVGGTGTGKTSLVNSILTELNGTKERIAIVEEVPELIVDKEKIRNLLRYITTPDVQPSKILKSLMRQRPDRIIYGEIRWGEEAETLLDGLNTGHSGGLTTIHANSALDGLHRLEELLSQIPGKSQPRPYMVARGIDVAIHLKRERLPDGRPRRFIDEIIEIKGYDKIKEEYKYEEVK
jgi:type II secretion system protein E